MSVIAACYNNSRYAMNIIHKAVCMYQPKNEKPTFIEISFDKFLSPTFYHCVYINIHAHIIDAVNNQMKLKKRKQLNFFLAFRNFQMIKMQSFR